jgi:hypothetical protein
MTRAAPVWGATGFAVIVWLGSFACRSSQSPSPPSIAFTRLPTADHGSPDIVSVIEGRVTGVRPEQRIVLFARSGQWWVQPLAARPFTPIAKDATWKSSTHPGNAYAALLVDPGYNPPVTANALPPTGGAIRAVAIAEGAMLSRPKPNLLQFSGYEWAVRQAPGAGTAYATGNASVDDEGFLHLRISRNGATGWTSSQLELTRSLGYGSYRFVVRDVSRFEPAAALALSVTDETGPNREITIEVSRWGESAGKNAQFVIQPYFIPANVVRFLTPPGRLAYSFVWKPGRVEFTTRANGGAGRNAPIVAAHAFTSGIPSPGSEAVRLHLYAFYSPRNPLQHDVEVVIEKFEFLP